MRIKQNIFIMLFFIIAIAITQGCGGVDRPSNNKQLSGFATDDGALPVYEGYIGENPDSVKSGNKLGVWYLKTGRFDKAISGFEATLAKEPGEPFATYYNGLAYLGKGNFNKAIQIWQGYKNKDNPILEEAISRQITLLRIAQSRKLATKALAQEKTLMATQPASNTVAVCYYEDLSPDKSLHAFRKGLAAMIISDLSKIKSIQVVERIRLQALLEEMKLGQTGLVKQGTAPKVGKLLGARNIVLGNLSIGSIKAITTLASTETENIKGSESASVEKDKFFELPAIIIKDIAKIMGIKLADKEKKAIGVVHTKVYNALVHYGNALDALDAGKWQEAKSYFDMALKEDPNFDLAKEAAYSCPEANYPNINNLINLKGSKISTAIESLMSSEESKLIMDTSTAVDSLINSDYTGTDILGIDIGDLGITGVGEETLGEENIEHQPPTGGQLPTTGGQFPTTGGTYP
ncbi:MAG: tetratricopeptide repeat protein [Proteobacteria bacterium]|nr:tetratricopeptide repeat protein [Pseudomonadota bacterium]